MSQNIEITSDSEKKTEVNKRMIKNNIINTIVSLRLELFHVELNVVKSMPSSNKHSPTITGLQIKNKKQLKQQQK